MNSQCKERRPRGTRLLIFMSVLLNVVGNLFLCMGMRQVGEIISASPLSYIPAFLNPWVIAGVCLLAVWIVSQLSLLSRADLSYVLSVTSVSYIFAAILGSVFLHEEVSVARWAGILAITLGVALVGSTAPRTTVIRSQRTGDRE